MVLFMHFGSDTSWGAAGNLRQFPWHVHRFFCLGGYTMAATMAATMGPAIGAAMGEDAGGPALAWTVAIKHPVFSTPVAATITTAGG